MHRLKAMKESLVNCVEGQIYGHLQEVDTKELGDAIDMIKDLAEAIYYCSITEAMEKSSKEKEKEVHYYHPYPMGEPWDGGYGGNRDGNVTRRYYNENMSSQGGSNTAQSVSRDAREGRSPAMRRMYMESKELHKDKHSQMRDLENYMKELSTDITEMISDATPDEKIMLQQKLNMLATKIGGNSSTNV